nr:hypothetical protein [Tanacetum cinerariifolium]
MIAFSSKSDESDGFDQIVDFLNAEAIHYALVVNPTIYVSYIKQFWATALIKKVNDVVKLQALIDRKTVVAIEEEEDEEDEVHGAPTPPSPIHTCVTLSQKVTHLEQDKIAQALEILKLKRRVANLEKQRRSKSSGLKRLRKVGGKIAEIDANEDITLVDRETKVDLGAERHGRKDDSAADKEVNVVEPTVFNDEEVTMPMAQTLIKMKAEKARLLDEQMAKRLHDEEVEQAAAREKQEKEDLEKAKVLQKQYEDKQENINWNIVAEQMQEKHLDNIRKYQSLKRKPISIAQAKKNMIKSFKKLKAVEVSGSHSTQDTLTDDPKEMSKEDVKNMLEIIPVTEFKVESLQIKEDLDALWRLVKERFSTALPTVNKEKALWVKLKRLFKPDADDVIWKLQRYMHYPIIERLSLVKWNHDPDAEHKATS